MMNQPLDDRKKTKGHWNLKKNAPDCTLWRTRFERVYGPVVRQTIELMNKRINLQKGDYLLF